MHYRRYPKAAQHRNFKTPQHLLWLSIIFFSCSLLAAACGNETPATTVSVNNSPTAPLTLRIFAWENSSPNEALRKINARFQQKYPNITVDFAVIPSPSYSELYHLRLQANEVDIFATLGLSNSAKEWTPTASKPTWQSDIENGLVENLSGKAFLKNYDPQALQNASTYNGKVYTVTTGKVINNGVYYNKAIFERLKLQPPTTFNELVKICETLQTNGLTAFTLGGAETWPVNFLFNNLATNSIPDTEAILKGLWAGTVKWTDPRLIKVLEQAQTMLSYTEKDFLRLSNKQAVQHFAEEKAAMLPTGIWEALEISRLKPDLKFGYFVLPSSSKAEENTSFSGKYDLAWALNAKTNPAQKEAALRWLEFFSDPENYTEYVNAAGFLPVQPNVNLSNTFLKTLIASNSNFKLDWEQLGVGRQGADKFTLYMQLQLQYLEPAGPHSPTQLAQLAQEEWENAIKKK